jgi:hypothetical protein
MTSEARVTTILVTLVLLGFAAIQVASWLGWLP